MTIKVRVSDGTLKPLDKLDLKEGDEFSIIIVSPPPIHDRDWLEKTSGGWAGLVDAEKLKREIYESRLLANRAEPRL